MIGSVKKQRIFDLLEEGYTVTQISKLLYISRPTIYRVINEKPVDKSLIYTCKILLTKISNKIYNFVTRRKHV
jgi:DNA invertase Pin-like site-specific DNA recombinase